MLLGLEYVIWAVLAVYFAGMLAMGWWSRRRASRQSGYLIGDRRFGTPMMVMHSFGAGTNPGDAAGVISGSVAAGASGVWASWLWLFGTPFYWLVAPLVRRMRCLTLADFFEERFGRGAAALYIVVASVGMVVCLSSVLLATTSTVQGMMGKAAADDAEAWFFGILFVSTLTFMVYSYWGGIVAAIRTDFIQGLMIIFLSFMAVPAALNLPSVGGLSGMRETLAAASEKQGVNLLSMFDPGRPPVATEPPPQDAPAAVDKPAPKPPRQPPRFDLWIILLLCVQAPLSALALPHLITVCGAGKSEWEGRMGFAGGNMLKRICTIGWAVLGLCWLAHLTSQGIAIDQSTADAAFGESLQHLLPPFFQGLMLASIMAAAMSSGNAFQVTVAGLFSENLYRRYVRPEASDHSTLMVTKITGVVYVLAAVVVSIGFRDVVGAIMAYFTILALVGISTAMGLLWRRMNQAGVYGATILAVATFLGTRIAGSPRAIEIGAPLVAGVVGGVLFSLISRPPDPKVVERFFTKIYTPIGQEEKLEQSLDEAVPPSEQFLTAGGLFIVKPSRESWVGFLAFLGLCVACVAAMQAVLSW